MNKQDENKLVMMKALLSLLKLNRAIWEGSAPFAAAVEDLENLILGIESLRQSTDVDQSGQVAEKRTLKANLVNKNFEIISQHVKQKIRFYRPGLVSRSRNWKGSAMANWFRLRTWSWNLPVRYWMIWLLMMLLQPNWRHSVKLR